MSIHPSAIIHPEAQIAENVEIGPFCLVEKNTIIGEGCVLRSHVVVREYVQMGKNNTCHAGAVIGDIPQDVGFDASNVSYVKIGDGNTFREGFTVHRGTKPDSETTMGSNGFFMANTHIAHNCEVGDEVIMAPGAMIAGYVTVGDKAFLSGNAAVHQFVTIGRLAIVSGLCALSKDVPPFCACRGASLNTIAGLNTVGLRRAGVDADERNALRKTFRDIFMGNRPITKAAQACKEASDSPLVAEFTDFILNAKRGVCAMSGGE